jgi:type I site-specific restriction endonuclease
MIEFKQIIGRGTRLYDGKDYFTIYDFVKAYLHFNDPEWDGEPLEPEPCKNNVALKRNQKGRIQWPSGGRFLIEWRENLWTL